jgi:hypothetical protein
MGQLAKSADLSRDLAEKWQTPMSRMLKYRCAIPGRALRWIFISSSFLLLSPTFRRIVAAVPQHGFIGIQAFRILGSEISRHLSASQVFPIL